jgi:hypothetical protein
MDLIDLAEDRNKWQVVLNSNEPSGSKQCGEFLD